MSQFDTRLLRPVNRFIQKPARTVLRNPLFQIPLAVILLLPLMATIGQYLKTGFMWTSPAVPLLFWPRAGNLIAPAIPVWLAGGAMFVSYVAGIIFLVRKRNLGIVAILGLASMFLTTSIAAVFNSLAGWQETAALGNTDLAGKANAVIFSVWHNPVWEEVVFRGIPLLILLIIIRKVKNKSVSAWAVAGFLVIPSIAFSIYHLPGHGPSRIVDTFILGFIFAWMTLRFTFFAPLVLHCFFDGMMVINLGNGASNTDIPREEITWLVDNHSLLNSIFTGATVFLAALIPILLILYWKGKRGTGAARAL